MDGLRQLHRADPTAFSTPILAERFRISPEAVRRILKSRWEPTREQRALFAEKERLRRSAFIRTSRMKERIQAMELEQITGPRDGRGDRVRGADGKDRLTFQ
jgi:hypothetical protein